MLEKILKEYSENKAQILLKSFRLRLLSYFIQNDFGQSILQVTWWKAQRTRFKTSSREENKVVLRFLNMTKFLTFLPSYQESNTVETLEDV